MPQLIRELSKGKRDIWNLDPHAIKIKTGWNIRDETPELKAHIEEIARSIQAAGYDAAKPLTIYQDGDAFFVSDGHCRIKAVLLAIKWGADIKAVPCIMEARGVDEADRVAGMLTRNNGRNLTPLEQGRVYKLLQGFGWTDEQIAKTSGKTIAHVRGIFDLMGADPKTQASVIAGDVAATTVAKAVRQHGPAKAREVVEKAIKTSHANGRAKATGKAVAEASGEPVQAEKSDLALAAEVLEKFYAFAEHNELAKDEIGCSLKELQRLIAKLAGKKMVLA